MSKSFARRVAHSIAESWFLRRGKRLWEENQKDWNLPLCRKDKVLSGIYVITAHFSEGRFPPTFSDQQKVYETERTLKERPGVELEVAMDQGRRKPFWFTKMGCTHLRDFVLLTESLMKLGIKPPAKLLELACGAGWAADLLSQMEFAVVGSTISPVDVEEGRLRPEAHRIRRMKTKLEFVCVPMEDVHAATAHLGPFDAVYVYEALHHAYDWRKACEQAYACLKPGGWFLMCNEPNLMHTFVAYRYSQLSKSPEIGFSKSEVFTYMEQIGFRNGVVLGKRFGFYARPFWAAFQRPA